MLLKTHSGKEIELSQEEMQSLFEMLQKMEGVNGSTPNVIVELEDKIFDLEREKDRLQNEVDTDNTKDELEELKQKIKDIVEEF
jgi:predicted RNase H-like nuclease (RuvC/YqgF family)